MPDYKGFTYYANEQRGGGIAGWSVQLSPGIGNVKRGFATEADARAWIDRHLKGRDRATRDDAVVNMNAEDRERHKEIENG